MLLAWGGGCRNRISAEKLKCRLCGRRMPLGLSHAGEGNLPCGRSCVEAWAVGVSAPKPGRSREGFINLARFKGRGEMGEVSLISKWQKDGTIHEKGGLCVAMGRKTLKWRTLCLNSTTSCCGRRTCKPLGRVGSPCSGALSYFRAICLPAPLVPCPYAISVLHCRENAG